MGRPKRSKEEADTARAVGIRLRQIRDERSLTREEFVRRLGKGTRRALIDYENGRISLPTELARRVCSEFGVSLDWLLSGSGEKSQVGVVQQIHDRHRRDESYHTLKAVQDIVSRYSHDPSTGFLPDAKRPDDIFSRALRIALSKFERTFNDASGPTQVANFIEDLILIARDLAGEDLRLLAMARRGHESQERIELMAKLFGVHPHGIKIGKGVRKDPRDTIEERPRKK